jgi:hypothetical protein
LKKFIEWLWDLILKNLEPKKNDSILNRVKKRVEKTSDSRSAGKSPEVEKKVKVEVNPEKVFNLMLEKKMFVFP